MCFGDKTLINFSINTKSNKKSDALNEENVVCFLLSDATVSFKRPSKKKNASVHVSGYPGQNLRIN